METGVCVCRSLAMAQEATASAASTWTVGTHNKHAGAAGMADMQLHACCGDAACPVQLQLCSCWHTAHRCDERAAHCTSAGSAMANRLLASAKYAVLASICHALNSSKQLTTATTLQSVPTFCCQCPGPEVALSHPNTCATAKCDTRCAAWLGCNASPLVCGECPLVEHHRGESSARQPAADLKLWIGSIDNSNKSEVEPWRGCRHGEVTCTALLVNTYRDLWVRVSASACEQCNLAATCTGAEQWAEAHSACGSMRVAGRAQVCHSQLLLPQEHSDDHRTEGKRNIQLRKSPKISMLHLQGHKQ